MADREIGEIYLNLMLSEEMRNFCGVDVYNASTEEVW